MISRQTKKKRIETSTNTKKIIKQYKRKSKTKKQSKSEKQSKSKPKQKSIPELIKSNILKKPELLRVGYISKEINGIRYVVRIKRNKKYYAIANKYEIDCHLKLRNNIKKYISIFKTGNSPFKTMNNAISFAIRDTEREFIKCTTTNRKYNRSMEGRTYTKKLYDDYNYYSKYWYYKVARYLSKMKNYVGF